MAEKLNRNDPPKGGSGVPGFTGDLLKNCGILDLSKLTENSVIVIRGQDHSTENINTIMNSLKPHVPKNTVIWLAQEGEALEVISEDDMNRLGWYRKNENKK